MLQRSQSCLTDCNFRCSSVLSHHGSPQAPHKTQDCQKANQEVHSPPIWQICEDCGKRNTLETLAQILAGSDVLLIFQYLLYFFRKTGASPEVLTTESAGGSRVRCWCPTLVMVATRRPSTCCPPASRSSWSTMSRSLRSWWWATSKLLMLWVTFP